MSLLRKKRTEKDSSMRNIRKSRIVLQGEFKSDEIGKLSFLEVNGSTYCRDGKTNGIKRKDRENFSKRKKFPYIININRIETSRTPQFFTTRRGFIILIKFFQFLLLLVIVNT